MYWFKIAHGFCTDKKFGIVAHQLNIPRAYVIAVAVEMLEYASRNRPRGSIIGLNEEEIVFNLGIDVVTLRNVIVTLRNRRFCDDEKICHWNEYQSNGDNTNAERQKRFRNNKKENGEKNRNGSNALRNTDKIRGNNTPQDSDESFGEPPIPPSLQLFEDQFDEFWKLFPGQRKGSKQKAQKSYEQALKRSPADKILEGVKRYVASDEVARGFAKGAAAWLNDDRWNHRYKPASAEQKSEEMTPEQRQAIITKIRRETYGTE